MTTDKRAGYPKLRLMGRVSAGQGYDRDEGQSIPRLRYSEDRAGLSVLMEAKGYWDGMAKFRRDRTRNKRYTYGDQWKDKVVVDGKEMTEESYIRSQGNIPLKNNLIRRLVSSVLGVWQRMYASRGSDGDPDTGKVVKDYDVGSLLRHTDEVNHIDELYSRSMEEFLVSGLVIHRKWFGVRGDVADCRTDIVQPDNFFLDTNMRDPRGLDCCCIGEVHDIPFRDMLEWFASSPEDYARLTGIFGKTRDENLLCGVVSSFGSGEDCNTDFLLASDPRRCRVVEVWRKESRQRYRCHDYATGEIFKIEAGDYQRLVVSENERRLRQAVSAGLPSGEVALIKARWILDSSWFYYYLTPFGDILSSGETPYSHRGHPYVFKAYPFIDGEIHSFVSDVIDQQRYTNRLITMYDWIMRSSAKGLLLFPENCLPDGMSIDEIADQWSRYNGIVLFKAKPGVPVPQQITNNATNVGITELLNLQLKFFEDISGVNNALQGKVGFAGQSAALFSQQTENATTSLLDLLASFDSFVNNCRAMDMSNIRQFVLRYSEHADR